MRLVGSSAGLVNRFAACHPAQWKGTNTVVPAYPARHFQPEVGVAPAGGEAHGAAVQQAVLPGRGRMHLRDRRRTDIHQLGDAPRLRARLVLGQVPPRGEGKADIRRPGVSAGSSCRTGNIRARPLAVGNPSANRRGVPACSSSGQGQNTPSLASILA